MTQRILMPLDGSKLGEAAISYVSNMIAKMDPKERVEVILLHVIRNRHSIQLKGGVGMMSVPYNDDELTSIKSQAETYLKSLKAKLQGPQVSVTCMVSASETPGEEIIKIEQQVNADLVAMSTHGRGGVSRFAIGSVADKVMRGGCIPVLMVRASEEKP